MLRAMPVRADGIGVETQLQDVARFGIRSVSLASTGSYPMEPSGRSTRSRKSATPRTPSCTNGIW